jgi:N-acetylneuraminic acid mutarotase
MSTGRDFFGCIFGGDGRLYAIGGGPAASMSTAEIYDPATDAWAPIAGLPEPRGSLSAAVDGLGRVYAIGGTAAWPNASANVWRYDPIADRWDSVANMSVPRMRFASATDSQGRIYAIGTNFPAGEPHGTGATVERYDALTDTWSLLAPLPWALDGPAAAYAGADNAIYVFGGWEPGFTNEIVRYDIASDTWSTWGQMSYAKNNLAAVPSPDGYVYFFGGEGPGIHEARAEMQKVVPEPATLASGVLGLSMLAGYLRRRMKV